MDRRGGMAAIFDCRRDARLPTFAGRPAGAKVLTWLFREGAKDIVRGNRKDVQWH